MALQRAIGSALNREQPLAEEPLLPKSYRPHAHVPRRSGTRSSGTSPSPGLGRPLLPAAQMAWLRWAFGKWLTEPVPRARERCEEVVRPFESCFSTEADYFDRRRS